MDSRVTVFDASRVTIVFDECQERYDVIFYFCESSHCASVEYFPFADYFSKTSALKAAMQYAMIFMQ